MSLEPESLVRATDLAHGQGYTRKPYGMVMAGSRHEGELAHNYSKTPRLYAVIDDPTIVRDLAERWQRVEGTPSKLKVKYFEDKPGRGTEAEITVTEHLSIFRYSFPTYSERARLVVDYRPNLFGDTVNGSKTIQRIDAHTWKISNHLGGEADVTVYQIVKFSKEFNAWGTFEIVDGSPVTNPGADSISGEEVGFYVEYTSDSAVEVVVAHSFKGFERAESYLSEYDGDFDAAVEALRQSWNEVLRLIEIEACEAVKRTFYTHLFTIFLNLGCYVDESPRLDSIYRNVMDVGSGPFWSRFNGYTSCWWDQSRAVYPLLALLKPDVMAHILNTMLADYQRRGYLSSEMDIVAGRDWFYWNVGQFTASTYLMAYRYGIEDVDYHAAFNAVKDTLTALWPSDFWSLGYIARERSAVCVSHTYEGGVLCEHLALLARELGEDSDYEYYIGYRDAWRRNWDDCINNPRAKYIDGSWASEDEGFFEGDAEDWRYTPGWSDALGLFDKISIEELAYYLENGIRFNDYMIIYPYIPIYGGHHRYAQRYLRRMFLTGVIQDTPFEEKNPPDGSTFQRGSRGIIFYPSNSALIVFAILGLFPVMGSASYIFTTPLIDRAVIHTPRGDITLIADGNHYPLENFKILNVGVDSVEDHGDSRCMRIALGDGALILSPQDEAVNRSLSTIQTLQDFTLKMRLRWTPGASGLSGLRINFREIDVENTFSLDFMSDGATRLGVYKGGAYSELKRISFNLTADEVHDVELHVSGSKLTLKVDGVEVMTYSGLEAFEGHVGISGFYTDQRPYYYIYSYILEDGSGKKMVEEDFTDTTYIRRIRIGDRCYPSLFAPLDILINREIRFELSNSEEDGIPIVTAVRGTEVKDAEYDEERKMLRIEVDGPSGSKGEIIIDCQGLGRPTDIKGASIHSIDGELLRLIVNHQSPTTITLTWRTDPKRLIIDLLSDPEDGVKVYDDEGQPIPGVISAAWYDEQIFKEADWQITVGPIAGARAEVLDIGARHKAIREHIQLSIWVKRKHEANYTPERLRRDLIQEVERILFKAINNPGGGIEHINLSNWIDRDEPQRRILRSILTIQVEYEKERM